MEGITEIPISWPVGRNTSGDLGLEVGAVLWPLNPLATGSIPLQVVSVRLALEDLLVLEKTPHVVSEVLSIKTVCGLP